MGTWVASSRPHRHRRHHRHHHRGGGRGRGPVRVPTYARFAIPVLVVLLLGWLVWQGAHSLLHFGRNPGSANARAQRASISIVPPWVRDFTDSLDASELAIGNGNLSAAEIDVDRAESFVTIAGLEHRPAPPDFFRSASAQLDRVAQQNPGDRRLFEHVTSARIELAGLRSAQEIPPSQPAGIVLDSPRYMDANQTLSPSSLGRSYLDATQLPELSEMLVPPASRALADNVRVEDLTLAGAAQTLDGIRWRNVTFVGTRLRYEGGGLSLQNVRFVRCRFGFPADERGARIAGAITLAPPPGAITIEIPAAASAE